MTAGVSNQTAADDDVDRHKLTFTTYSSSTAYITLSPSFDFIPIAALPCVYMYMKTLNVFTPFSSSPSMHHLDGGFIIILVVYDVYDSGSFNKQ